MARCDHCGNDYAHSFDVITASGSKHTFDCYECAIHLLAPACNHCGCRIIGHGVEQNGTFYCCAHCARQSGVSGLVDNTATAAAR